MRHQRYRRQKADFPGSPCCLSLEQQCEPERRCFVREREQRCSELERDTRLPSEHPYGLRLVCLFFNRPTLKRDVSLHKEPKGTSLTNSGDAGKVEHQVNWVEFGRCHLAVEEVGPKTRKAMRREGYIMPEILDYNNISDAIDEVLRGTERKESEEGKEILADKDATIRMLQSELADGSFEIGEFHEVEIKENGKTRKLQIIKVIKRVGVCAVMRVVDRHLRPRFIRTTAASIKDRGMHDLLDYICDDMRRDPQGTKFALQEDICKFYDSIVQEWAMYYLHRVFKDPILLVLLEKFVRMLPFGLSMGLRSSQGVSDTLMSYVLDHVLKDKYGVKYYYRYRDDLLILSGSKKTLWKIRNIVHECVESVDLTIKTNERVFPIGEGIDMLGYVIYSADYVELRKRNKKKFARKLAKVKSRKRRAELIAAFYGMAKHADCNNLFQKLTGKSMKNFKDLGVSYAPADGKKHFPGISVSIRDLVNLPIVVKDFETGIKTDQGDDRTLVAFEQNGEPKKFFTSSIEMRNILEQIREMPDGFPFETTIKTEPFGKGKTKYIFT